MASPYFAGHAKPSIVSIFEMSADDSNIDLMDLKTSTNSSRLNSAIKYGEPVAAASQRRSHKLAAHATFIRNQNVDIGHT
jgi:hypothetical protein